VHPCLPAENRQEALGGQVGQVLCLGEGQSSCTLVTHGDRSTELLQAHTGPTGPEPTGPQGRGALMRDPPPRAQQERSGIPRTPEQVPFHAPGEQWRQAEEVVRAPPGGGAGLHPEKGLLSPALG
jgi:hypothetical protein